MWYKMEDMSRVSEDIQLLSLVKMVIHVQDRESVEQTSNSQLSKEVHQPLREFS
jgi:hypothetical protein